VVQPSGTDEGPESRTVAYSWAVNTGLIDETYPQMGPSDRQSY
jgi:hypothetical protein